MKGIKLIIVGFGFFTLEGLYFSLCLFLDAGSLTRMFWQDHPFDFLSRYVTEYFGGASLLIAFVLTVSGWMCCREESRKLRIGVEESVDSFMMQKGNTTEDS